MTFKSRTFLLLLLSSLVACHHTKPATETPGIPVAQKDLVPLSHFTKVDSCSPTLEWNAVRIPNGILISYDVSLYSAKKIDSHGFDKDEKVFYKQNYPVTSLSIIPPLEPNTKYLWSIRVRQHQGTDNQDNSKDKVSQWSTNSKTVKRPLAVATYIDHWHGFITPENCSTSSQPEIPAEISNAPVDGQKPID